MTVITNTTENFNELQKWSNKWQLKLNAAKCKIISLRRGDMAEYECTISQNLAIQLRRVRSSTSLDIFHLRRQIIQTTTNFQAYFKHKIRLKCTKNSVL